MKKNVFFILFVAFAFSFASSYTEEKKENVEEKKSITCVSKNESFIVKNDGDPVIVGPCDKEQVLTQGAIDGALCFIHDEELAKRFPWLCM